MQHMSFPFGVDGAGRTQRSQEDAHIREMLKQLLFTNPGERVNRPDFGCGLLQLLFAPGGPEAATAVQFTVQSAIQRWMGELIRAESVEAQAEENLLRVRVTYARIPGGARQTEIFERSL